MPIANDLKTLVKHSFVPPLLTLGALIAFAPTLQADCFGYPPSNGCTVNGVTGQVCRAPTAAGARIYAGNPAGSIFCTNAGATNPLLGSPVCVIEGGAGPDLIRGATTISSFPAVDGPANIICGGGGDDVILGGTQNDVAFGEAGVDLLVGGLGTNYLSGGTGNDTLILGTPQPSASFDPNSNFNFGGESASDRDICQAGIGGFNALPECEVRVP